MRRENASYIIENNEHSICDERIRFFMQLISCFTLWRWLHSDTHNQLAEIRKKQLQMCKSVVASSCALHTLDLRNTCAWPLVRPTHIIGQLQLISVALVYHFYCANELARISRFICAVLFANISTEERFPNGDIRQYHSQMKNQSVGWLIFDSISAHLPTDTSDLTPPDFVPPWKPGYGFL